jgi:Tol biopolymer transport system component
MFTQSSQIKFINSDGSGETQLTNTTHDEVNPKLSPDKSKIVFQTERHGGAHEIYAINSDGTGETRLTSNSQHDNDPSWSPDGSKIVYVTYEEVNGVSRHSIYTMNVDGSAKTRITPLEPTYNNVFNQPALPYYAGPLWNPASTKIVFLRFANSWTLYSVNADGSDFAQVSTGQTSSGDYSWSPDGSKLAYTSDELDPGENDLWVLDSNGTKARVTPYGSNNVGPSRPAWSPNGTKIAYVYTNYSNGAKGIIIRNADGSNYQEGTQELSRGSGSNPAWSPDGSKITFFSQQDGHGDIYIMNATGTLNNTRLTTATSSHPSNTDPIWAD